MCMLHGASAPYLTEQKVLTKSGLLAFELSFWILKINALCLASLHLAGDSVTTACSTQRRTGTGNLLGRLFLPVAVTFHSGQPAAFSPPEISICFRMASQSNRFYVYPALLRQKFSKHPKPARIRHLPDAKERQDQPDRFHCIPAAEGQ